MHIILDYTNNTEHRDIWSWHLEMKANYTNKTEKLKIKKKNKK